MLPTSHQVQTRFPPPASPELLAEAFSDFISASARLELSYRDLQSEVQQLSRELADRNLALEASLAENREMRQSLEQILDSMPCGVLVVNSDGEIRLANPEAARLLALPATQLNSLAAVQAARGIDLSLDRDLAEDAPEQELALHPASPGLAGGPSTEAPTTRWLAIRRRSLQGPASLAHHRADAVVILRDVSARRRIEAEREAARSAVALAEVAAMLAHEIRNPLASMELFAGLLAEPSPTPASTQDPATRKQAAQKHTAQKHTTERAEWVSHLRAGIRSLSGTVNNVLTLHGGAPPPLEHLELEHELALAVDFLAPLARQARVTVHLASPHGEPTGPTAIRANKNALHQLILNLCSNALRHTPAGGSVTLSIEEPQQLPAADSPRRIAVHVADTGCGIPPEYLSHLFHGRFSGSGSSPGLGLAVCARLMRQHHGAISVRSRPGHGSTFTLEFPAL